MRSLRSAFSEIPPPQRPNTVRGGRFYAWRMRTMFSFYLLFVAAGIAYFVVIGLAHH
jgi:hypothetical protein